MKHASIRITIYHGIVFFKRCNHILLLNCAITTVQYLETAEGVHNILKSCSGFGLYLCFVPFYLSDICVHNLWRSIQSLDNINSLIQCLSMKKDLIVAVESFHQLTASIPKMKTANYFFLVSGHLQLQHKNSGVVRDYE